MKLKNEILSKGSILVIIAAILWGLDGTVHIIPYVIMNGFMFKEYKWITKFNGEDFLYFSLISLFGGAIGTIAIVKALFLVNFQSLSVVVLLQKLQPVFAILLAYLLLKEKPKKHFYLWAGIAVVASYFLTFGLSLPNIKTGSNTFYAALFSLLAAFSYGSSTVFSKKVLNKFSFHTSTFYRFFFTTVIMLIYVH